MTRIFIAVTLKSVEEKLPENQKLLLGKTINYWLKIVVLFLLVCVGFYVLVLGFSKFSGKKEITSSSSVKQTGVSVSGKINLNGVVPAGATISLAKKEFGKADFSVVESGLSAVDGAGWSIANLDSGVAYYIEAYLFSNGQKIATSEREIIVAPATDEVLTINFRTNAPAQKATISGKLDLNGYFPPGSSISISAKKAGEAQSTPVVNGIGPIDGISFSWDNAESGVSYEIQALLVDTKGKTLSQSVTHTITAPAYNEELRINSTAKSPASNLVSVSGRISFNGPIPSGSSISVAQRESGQTQFSIFVSGLGVADGATWSFNQAKPGVTYDFQAYLMSGGNTVARSGIVAVAAPAVNEVLSLSMTTPPAAPPSSSLSYDCLGSTTVNNVVMWQARISYNNNSFITNAQQFHLVVGSSSGGNQIADITANPKDPNHPEQGQSYTTGYVLTQGQTYYVQYAYSTCCNVFSNFSPVTQFSCQPGPTNTPGPTSTPKPTNTPVPQPTDTPTPTPTPKISQCNESCGGSGYTCVTGLDCIQTGGGIGGSACRNSNCPDQTDCTCP